MTPAERWQADAACRDCVARSTWLLDHGDLEAFADCFTEDAVLVCPGGQLLQGRAAILQAYRARAPGRMTRHLPAAGVTDFDGDDSARCRTPVLLWAGDAADAEGPQGRPARGPALVGLFDDHLRRGPDGRWRIARREARFDLHAPAS